MKRYALRRTLTIPFLLAFAAGALAQVRPTPGPSPVPAPSPTPTPIPPAPIPGTLLPPGCAAKADGYVCQGTRETLKAKGYRVSFTAQAVDPARTNGSYQRPQLGFFIGAENPNVKVFSLSCTVQPKDNSPLREIWPTTGLDADHFSKIELQNRGKCLVLYLADQ